MYACVFADMREGERGKVRKWDRKNAETLPSQKDPGQEMGLKEILRKGSV